MPPVVGGRYRVERRLATGGSSVVYVATDLTLNRRVALKRMRGGAHEWSDQARTQFERETRVLAQLRHGNIVTIFDAGWLHRDPYIVTELLEGETLRERLNRGKLKTEESLRVGRELIAGLIAVHEAGLVHRDVKPENVFLSRDGTAKLLDFGLVKLREGESTPVPQPAPARRPGSSGYMSPEQLRGGIIDARTDLFAFGALMHETCSGRSPFVRDTLAETSYATLTQEPPRVPRSVPREVAQVIERCLQKDPARRPARATEVLESLRFAGRHPRVAARSFALGAAAALAGLLALAIGWPRGEPWVGPRTLRVLPFDLHADTKYEYLRDGMVDLLSRELSTAGVRIIDPHVMTLASISAIAGRRPSVGADYVVTGSIVELGDKLQAEAELRDVNGKRIALARATSVSGNVFALVDGLSQKLADGLERKGAPHSRLEKLAALTTTDPQALQSFLQGEAALRRGDYDKAVESFQSATRQDPDFVLAHFRFAMAAGGSHHRDTPASRDALVKALAGLERLPTRDRTLVRAFDALRHGRAPEAEDLLTRIVATNPDDVEAWVLLGETRYHYDPMRGLPPARAAEAFDRVLLLDPGHQVALLHRIDVAQLQHEEALVIALADRYLALPDREPRLETMVRAARASAARNPLSRVEIAAVLREENSSEAARDAVRRSLFAHDGLVGAEQLARALLNTSDPTDQVRAYQTLVTVLVGEGRLAEAERVIARGKTLPEGWRVLTTAGWIESIPEIGVSPARLERLLSNLQSLKTDHPTFAFQRAFAVGAVAERLGKRKLAEEQADALDALPPAEFGTLFPDLAKALRARVLESAGHPDQAFQAISGQILRFPYTIRDGFAHVAEPLLRARLLAGTGRTADAAQWASIIAIEDRLQPAWLAPQAWREAELIAPSDKARAALLYRRFATLWKSADPELQPRVAEALRRANALDPSGATR